MTLLYALLEFCHKRTINQKPSDITKTEKKKVKLLFSIKSWEK